MKIRFKVKMIPNWKREMRRVWSAKLIIASVFFLNLPSALPFLESMFDPKVFSALASVAAIAAFIARFIDQEDK